MHSNDQLLGTLCGKRQDAALVWIINILLHSLARISQLLHLWAAFSLTYMARENTTPTRAITRDNAYANLCNKVYKQQIYLRRLSPTMEVVSSGGAPTPAGVSMFIM